MRKEKKIRKGFNKQSRTHSAVKLVEAGGKCIATSWPVYSANLFAVYPCSELPMFTTGGSITHCFRTTSHFRLSMS